jgi:hypothetical protein
MIFLMMLAMESDLVIREWTGAMPHALKHSFSHALKLNALRMMRVRPVIGIKINGAIGHTESEACASIWPKNRAKDGLEGLRKLGHTQNEPLEGVQAMGRMTQPVNLKRLATWPFSINVIFVESNVVNSG